MRTVRSVTCSSLTEASSSTCCHWCLLRTGPLRNPDVLRQDSSTLLPRPRHKHSACCVGEYVYLFCGKDGTTPLHDIWKLHIWRQTWEKIPLGKVTLPYLQGHTAVSYKKIILLFGGTFGDAQGDIQLWIFNPDMGLLHEVWIDAGLPQPQCRRDHSAVVYNNVMYIYGGFIGSAGASKDLWAFNIDEEEWSNLTTAGENQPGIRYGHSAVVANNAMWLYGGMSGLHPHSDVWKYSLSLQEWKKIKASGPAPSLSGHSASVIYNQMVIVGGNSLGKPVNYVWSFTFDTCVWQKLSFGRGSNGMLPSLAFHSCVVVSPAAIHRQKGSASQSAPHLHRLVASRSYPERFESRPWSVPTVTMEKREDFMVTTGKKPQPRILSGDSSHFSEPESMSICSHDESDVRVDVSLKERLVLKSPTDPCFYDGCFSFDLDEEEGFGNQDRTYTQGPGTLEPVYDIAGQDLGGNIESLHLLVEPAASSSSPVLKPSQRRTGTNIHTVLQTKNDVFLEDLESNDTVLDNIKISYPSKHPLLAARRPTFMENDIPMPESNVLVRTRSKTVGCPSSESKDYRTRFSPERLRNNDSAEADYKGCKSRLQSTFLTQNPEQPRLAASSTENGYRMRSFGTGQKEGVKLQYLQTPVNHSGNHAERSSKSTMFKSSQSAELETSFIENTSLAPSTREKLTAESAQMTDASSRVSTRSPDSGYVSPEGRMSGTSCCHGVGDGCSSCGRAGKDQLEAGEPFLLVIGGRTEERGSVYPKPLAVWKGVVL